VEQAWGIWRISMELMVEVRVGMDMELREGMGMWIFRSAQRYVDT
jgi:hypothetical protein